MRRAHGVVIGAVAIVLAAFLGCSDDREIKQLAEGCSINSDCTDPLACAFGRCHVQCQSTRDCPPGTLCVAAATAKVCQLPDEAKCSPTKACPYGLVCTDATCRNGCQSNVECTVPGQECARGACYDRVAELDGGPLPTFPEDDAGVADAKTDAPIFVGGTGPLGFSSSNFDPKLVETVADGGSVVNLPKTTVTGTCNAKCLPPPTTIDMQNGVHADLYAFQDLVVEQSATLYFTDNLVSNPRPIIFAVAGTADIQGLIDVGGFRQFQGPGGFGGASPGPGFGSFSGSNVGGGGGSYCGKGGFGTGANGTKTSDTSQTYGTPEIIPLVGGSAGSGCNGDTSGYGLGAGGGVLQISAKNAIIVREFGRINAGGGGGLGGCNGHGAGSGGAILLEAPTVTILGALGANGGGGGGGPEGQGGRASDQPALGATQYGTGGSGSAGTNINGGDGIRPAAGDNGAGGGGGAGRIRINTATGSATITGIVSPSLGTPCATQGVLGP
ncbi:MAG: hypothetical protein U0270_29665 [Labilithrix sp.]